MKRLSIAISVAALALPLLAATEDSPLVRAAKATGRLSKKPKVVITNDTLVTSGGHLATTDATTPFVSGPQTYSNLPAIASPSTRGGMPVPERPTPPPAQPTVATSAQPGYTQATTAVGGMSTAPVSYSTTTQPTVTTKTTEPPIATVKPPQPE